MKKIFLLLILSGLLSGCDLFEAHPYDGKVTGETNINYKNSNLITSKLKDKKTFKFAMISDTHRWYDDTNDVIKVLNKRDDIDFVVHGGDVTDFGSTSEYMWIRNMMNKLDVPWITTIGNHDCLGTGKDVYRKVFGETDYAFTVADTRFIVLNTNALEFDYFDPVPNFKFISNELNNLGPDIKKTIFLMHVRPYTYMFNDNVAELFQQELKKFPNIQFCIYGHGHRLEEDDLFGDGIMYYQCPNIQKHIYLIFTINENDYNYEVVHF